MDMSVSVYRMGKKLIGCNIKNTERTSHSFKENQPMHRRRNFLNENFNENS